jgi:inositol-hexakisphosphate/diphosphoinositol-pentakisphosphate 1-kinase
MPITKVRLGVCAMNKKSQSQQMRAILQRLEQFNEFDIVQFTDECILRKAVEEWPECDALISFYSRGFPLEKAHAYVVLRKPFMVNDVTRQWTLLDRRLVYETLIEHNIPGTRARLRVCVCVCVCVCVLRSMRERAIGSVSHIAVS